jgi:hypothetical protein
MPKDAPRRTFETPRELRRVAEIPDTLVLARHRDLEGMVRHGIWWRRGILLLLAAFLVVALLDVFGQRPTTIRAVTPKVTFSVYVPEAIRGGDFMEARFHITAHEEVKNAILRLDPGWAEGMSMNTIEPVPIGQASDNGRLSFTLGHIPKGKSFILFIQFQVNPTNVAWNRQANAELDDGNTRLASLHHTITVYP